MKSVTSSLVINWLVFLYFVILFGERLQSIVRSVTDKNVKLMGTAFNGYVYIITIVSLIAFLILLFTCNKWYLKALFSKDALVHEKINYLMLSITAGVILVGGMVHTEYTIPTIQFASYGLLIAALIVKTAGMNSASESSLLLWLSIVYLITFSMAIPVMYHSEIKNAGLFHIIEAVTALVLVAAFAFLMYRVLIGNAVNLFFVVPILIAVIGDAVILAMRWKEKVNGFVLIFLVVSVVLWIAGKIVSVVKKI